MKKEYSYRFYGNKNEFLEKAEELKKIYRAPLEDYLIEIDKDRQCRLGIERAGHSGGYWYIPAICEDDGIITLEGNVQYIDPWSIKKEDKTKGKVRKVLGGIGDIIIMIPLLIPMLVFVLGYTLWDSFRKWMISKKYHIPKRRTHEEKLDYLMVNWFQCEKL